MIHAEILNGKPFIYNLQENDNVINNTILSQKETFSSDENDIRAMGFSLDRKNDTFICFDKDKDGKYTLIGYLSFSGEDFGNRLKIEFLYGIDGEMINILLDRIKNYAVSNKHLSISAYTKMKNLDHFLNNGYKRGDVVFSNITGKFLHIPVFRSFDYENSNSS